MDTTINDLVQKIAQQDLKLLDQQKKIRRLTFSFITLLLLGFSLFIFSFNNNKNEIIRTKGIVITDDHGKDRILIGAPFPTSADRIRTNFEKSKKAWGERFGGNFDWYKTNPNIKNDGVGLLIMDENGHDRVVLGSPAPSSWVGRIAPVHGITIHDEGGIERGGYGLLRNEKINRMVLGLDHISGYEGAMMSVLEDGTTQVVFNDPNNINRLHLVNDKGTSAKWYKYDRPHTGIILKDSLGKTVSVFDVAPKK